MTTPEIGPIDGRSTLSHIVRSTGEHELTHDHAAEQPFTRTQEGVAILDGIDEVTIEGRDLMNGYGGPAVTVQLESS